MPRSRMAISDAGQRGQHHQLIEIAQMADAEHAARDFGKADAKRKIIAIVGMAHEGVAISKPSGMTDGAHRVGMPAAAPWRRAVRPQA